MNSLTLRCGAALLIGSALAACGGNDGGNLPVSGSIQGLNRLGLVLTNAGKELKIETVTNVFAFPDLLAPDTEFEVKVLTSPPGQKCSATNNKNKLNVYTYNSTVINCTTDPYPLGGTITGLTGSGLILANGSSNVAPLAGATTFVFATEVGNQLPYGVTVLQQPEGQTCTVANGSGDKMPAAPKLDIAVTCIKKA